MSLKQKLNKLESILDNMDLDNPEYAKLEAEANDIADQLNQIDEIYAQEAREQARLQEEKLAEIREWSFQGRINELVDKYGHEFVGDYTIEGNTIHSSVAPDHTESQWTVEDVNKKMRQLLYYRIYDRYLRAG